MDARNPCEKKYIKAPLKRKNYAPSPIQTILSVSELHRVHRLNARSRREWRQPSLSPIGCDSFNTGHGLTGKTSVRRITAGREFHPAPKDRIMLWLLSFVERLTLIEIVPLHRKKSNIFHSDFSYCFNRNCFMQTKTDVRPLPAYMSVSLSHYDEEAYASTTLTVSILSRPWNLSTCSMPEITLPNTVCWPSRCGCGW